MSEKDLPSIFEMPPDEMGLILEPAPPSESPAPLDLVEKAPLPAPPEKPDPLDAVRDYAENLPIQSQPAAAEVPFHLTIDGPLTLAERSKLLEFVSKSDIGIRELDLEPQFEAEKVFIPRISEYAGIVLVQMLRDSQARFKLVPADSDSESIRASSAYTRDIDQGPIDHPAETIELITAETPHHPEEWELLGAVSASLPLSSSALETDRTPEYDELLSALQKKLRYQTHHKGGRAVLGFAQSLTPLSTPTRFRLTLTGTAARKKNI